MRFKSEGNGIEYTVAGPRTGLPLVLIHGFPFSKEMWEPQHDMLAKDSYVVSYDIRGHGKSEVGDGQYSLELFVDDFIGLLEHLKISRCVAVGLSMGGYIALRAVERNPERIRALVLCDTKSEADNNEGKLRRAAQMKSIKAGGMESFSQNFVKTVFCSGTFEKNPAAVEKIRKIIASTSPLATAGTLSALAARTDTTAALYGINVPALILVGQQDILTPPSASNSMKEKIPDSEMHIIANAGHLSNMENPAEFNRHLAKFLDTLKG